jgi:hypothetical protein
MLYGLHLAMNGFELIALMVIGTDCTGSCKSNYHTITTMTTPQNKDNMGDTIRDQTLVRQIEMSHLFIIYIEKKPLEISLVLKEHIMLQKQVIIFNKFNFYSNMTSFFRFANKRAIYQLGIILLAHVPVHVTDFPRHKCTC